MLKRCSVALAVAVLATTVSPAAAQDTELPPDYFDAFDSTAEEVAELEPNESWDPLGLFSDDALRIISAATEPATGDTYAFGDSKTDPPVITPSGTKPTGVGSMVWQLPADWTPPQQGWADDMAFAQSARALDPGAEVALFWAEMDGDYDFTSDLTVNEGFPITVPGLPVWNSSFAGDTWEGANVIPNAVYDGTTLTFDVKGYEPPQQFPLLDLPGFYFRSGNVMAMALDADGLAALAPNGTAPAAAASEGVDSNLLFTGEAATSLAQNSGRSEALNSMVFRVFLHVAVELFSPGFIFLSDGEARFLLTVIVLLATVGILFAPPLIPAPEPEPEPDPDPDPAPDPGPAVVDPPSDTTPPSAPSTIADDSGFPTTVLILLILVGLILLVVGLLLFGGGRTRTRSGGDDDEEDEDDDDEDGDDDEEQEDLSSTPPPVIHSSTEDEGPDTRPIIFVPGVMASAISVPSANGPQTVWPPIGYGIDPTACFEALQATEADKMEISGITSTGLLPFIHLGLLGFLDSHGYKRYPTRGPANCYVHSYNWLRPCAEAGESLKALIARATAEHGQPPSIIAHSMGGLVTRSALLDGSAQVDKVIFCASPHYGAPMAYFSIHPDIPYAFVPGPLGTIFNAAYATATSGHDSDISFTDQDSWGITKALEGGLQAVEKAAETVAHAAFTGSAFDNHLKLVSQNATGVFELLPDHLYFEHINGSWPVVTHKQRWYRRSHGWERHDFIPNSPHDAYLSDNHKDIAALPPSLRGKIEAAMAFKRTISVPLPPGGDGRTIVVYGASHDTLCEAVMTDDGDATTRGDVEVELGGDQGGDGTVPRESGRGRSLWHGGVIAERDNGAEHFMLTETTNFHRIIENHIPPGGY